MSPRRAKPVDVNARIHAYFAAASPAARRRLQQMRTAIRAAAPGATPAFSYRIPAFRLNGRILVWYAAFTRHTSLFPIGAAIRGKYAAALAGFETSKGTVRFPLDRPLPVALLKRLVRARMADVHRSH